MRRHSSPSRGHPVLGSVPIWAVGPSDRYSRVFCAWLPEAAAQSGGDSPLLPPFPVSRHCGVQRDHGQRRQDCDRGCTGWDLPEEGKVSDACLEKGPGQAQDPAQRWQPSGVFFIAKQCYLDDQGLAPGALRAAQTRPCLGAGSPARPSSLVCPRVSPSQTECSLLQGMVVWGKARSRRGFPASVLVSQRVSRKEPPGQVDVLTCRLSLAL